MNRVLFVCTGNMYRSPLAAALFSRKLQAGGMSERWLVESAGTWTTPGRRVPPNFMRAARSFGIELKEHRTRQVSKRLLDGYDLIVVMEKGHREALRVEFPALQGKVHLLSQLADQKEYDVADPAGTTLAIKEIISNMSRMIDSAFPNICKWIESSGRQ